MFAPAEFFKVATLQPGRPVDPAMQSVLQRLNRLATRPGTASNIAAPG